jgi:Fe2+ transport system protein FeoA
VLPHAETRPQPSVQPPIRLSDLRPGRRARLHATTIAPQDCALLAALGLTDRCVLSVCKMGEPCIVQVRSTRIGISRTVADGILVVPDGQP